ncbi:DUF1294 domain-containing protein [Bacillus tianshenii]|nr:DUF1294 domain-containing protein [Bacillus tianshenii]
MGYLILAVLAVGMNLTAFIVVYIDKQRAIKGKQRNRISEKTLWRFAVLGGAFGIYGGMQQFRHKTKHRSFVVGVPFCILLNLLIYGGVLYLMMQ